MQKLVLLRHGQSLWNRENRFTGWVDVDLTDKGVLEARNAGRMLKSEEFRFDVAYTSVLKRAIRTLWLVLDEMDSMWVPVHKSFRLNERHYGALQGLNKKETAEKYGIDQVKIWRRSYSTPPPPVSRNDENYPGREPFYAGLTEAELPTGECLKDVSSRILPYWKDTIVPDLKKQRNILIAAHGNSLRALVKHLDKISDEEIAAFNIPTGIPLVYEFERDLSLGRRYFLGDTDTVERAMRAVASELENKQ